MMEEEYLTVGQVCELTGLEPGKVREYIRLGRLEAEIVGSVFDENYRVKMSALMHNPELRKLMREKAGGKRPHPLEEPLPEDANLIKLVDRYKAMLDEIAHYKLRGAALGASSSGKEKLKSDLAKKSKEAEELEREIVELRGKIIAKEVEIHKLIKPPEE